MMKRFLSVALLIVVLQMSASAQKTGPGYTNGLGFRIDFGSGETDFGFSGKHFFTEHHAGEAQLLFGSGITYIDLEYQYHAPIQNAAGLQWYAGIGPMFGFYSGGSDIFLRPVGGLDYKIDNAPVNFSFDWRPTFRITHSSYGDQFTAGRFGLAARYAF